MSLILNIDTAVDTGSVCLAKDGQMLGMTINEIQSDQAAWLHPAIASLLKSSGHTPKQLEAIGVSIGPGSYTGLRIGLAAAKGFCYALHIPLLSINTLKMMAFSVIGEARDLICPVIDARRMEVFTAVYQLNLAEIVQPQAMIVNRDSFSSLLSTHEILFCGNGREKIQAMISSDKAVFTATGSHAGHLAHLSYQNFLKKDFSSLAYTEPLYIKEFYSPLTEKPH